MIDKEAYTLRIAQATPAQLVVITFELTTGFIKEALNEEAAGNEEQYRRLIDKAKEGVMSLISGLDFSMEPAQVFYDIYLYVYELLIKSSVKIKREPAEEALELLAKLHESWRVAAKEENARPDASAPQVYAGLTYRRGGLAEYVVENESLDFKA